ncbi:hypothetical protein KCU98_g139, partial [Aureobasidium melanogenum]
MRSADVSGYRLARSQSVALRGEATERYKDNQNEMTASRVEKAFRRGLENADSECNMYSNPSASIYTRTDM